MKQDKIKVILVAALALIALLALYYKENTEKKNSVKIEVIKKQ